MTSQRISSRIFSGRIFVLGGIILHLSAVSSIAVAQTKEPLRGRLPDGRAYRTDAQGSQLVDYIAELEVTNDASSRRLFGLEDEVREKQKIIDRLTAGKGCQPALGERTLSGGTSAAAIDSSALLRAQGELARVQQELVQARQEGERCTRSCEENQQKIQSSLSAERQRVEESVKAREASEAERAKMKEDLEILTQTVKNRDQELGQLKADLVRAKALSSDTSSMRASYASERIRTAETLRGALSSEMNRVRGLIVQRDRAFQQLQARKRGIQLRATAPRTKDGIGIDDLAKRLRTLQSVEDVSEIRAALAEVASKIDDDLALARRMGAVR